MTPYDNTYVIQQIEDGHWDLLHHMPFSALPNDLLTGMPLMPIVKDGKHHPQVITLRGDHTIVLPLLHSIHSSVYVTDPIFFGYGISRQADCATKVVTKVYLTESVGVVMKHDGKYNMVEYSEILF